jgi:exodeoxyribonuclease VII large subunit
MVTSPTGAALRDMIHTIQRRFPLVEIVLAPSAVQGEEAPGGIMRGLQALNLQSGVDLILIARGGGSIEDLWAFNDEGVARAIAASEIPVICGVGHETDFTIADFVADLRAPTPTAAAELATPDRAELMTGINEQYQRLIRATMGQLATQRWQLNDLLGQLNRATPIHRIQRDRQLVDDLTHLAETALKHQMQLQHSQLTGLQRRLATLNPMAVLARGYAVVSDSHGELVRSVKQAQPGETFGVRVRDGAFNVRVEDGLPADPKVDKLREQD